MDMVKYTNALYEYTKKHNMVIWLHILWDNLYIYVETLTIIQENGHGNAGPLFIKKILSCWYRDSHFKPETVFRPA